MTRVLVYGLGIAGTSVARALVSRGHEVVLADDHLSRRERGETRRSYYLPE